MRTGIFFDGYHAVKHFQAIGNSKGTKDLIYGQIDFDVVIHKIIEKTSKSIKGDAPLNLRYTSWYQGIPDNHFYDKLNEPVNLSECNNIATLKHIIWKYHNNRNLYINLIRNGIETTFLELKKVEDESNPSANQEKGVDVALTTGVLNHVHDLELEVVILVTNDSDFRPLIHNLKKRGILVVVIHFNDKGVNCKYLVKEADVSLNFEDIIPDKALKDIVHKLF